MPNRAFAASMAAMMNEAGIHAELDPGGRVGEFTVWVDSELVVRKRFIRFPDKEEIMSSVKEMIIN